MKRALSLILALVLCLPLCACNNTGEIELTLENYSKYLTIKANVGEPSIFDGGLRLMYDVPVEGGTRSFVYEYFILNLDVKGVSTNFNYNDISITVRFSGTYQTYTLANGKWNFGNKLDTELTTDCNIAGIGSISTEFYPEDGYVLKERADIEWEVVAISGTITPVG